MSETKKLSVCDHGFPTVIKQLEQRLKDGWVVDYTSPPKRDFHGLYTIKMTMPVVQQQCVEPSKTTYEAAINVDEVLGVVDISEPPKARRGRPARKEEQ